MIPAAILFGVAIGITFGMVGGGGSILAMPVLVYVLGQNVHSATTASLVIVAAAALTGGFGYARGGLVCWRHVAAFAGPVLGGTLIGTALNRSVGGTLLLALFVPVMLVGAWATWRRAAGRDREHSPERSCPPLCVGRDALAGSAVGLLTGFFGVGGGFVIVPTLAVALGLPMRRAIGTSLVIAGLASFLGLAAHLASGSTIEIGVTAAMTASCVAGALAGSHLSAHISRQALGRGFAALVTGVATYLLVATAFLGGAPGR
jgi:uncharacterized membrane protein YfcA